MIVTMNEFFSNLLDVNCPRKDSDGRISKAELAAAITREDFIGTDADKIFSQMDVNRGGKVLFDEFCVYVANQYIDAKELAKVFKSTAADPIRSARRAPRKIGRRLPKRKNHTGRKGHDTEADIHTKKFDKREAKALQHIQDKEYLIKLWRQIDVNG